jgi:hypothetical protein
MQKGIYLLFLPYALFYKLTQAKQQCIRAVAKLEPIDQCNPWLAS